MATKTKTNCWDILDRMVPEVFPNRLTSLCLFGPPGTGKSSWAPKKLGTDRCEVMPLNEAVDQYGLLGALLPCVEDGKPTIKWHDGPAASAVRHGKILVLDEIDRASPELYPLLHALTECDPKQIRVRCADGTYLTPAPGYGVVATSNVSPDKLPEALQTRFLSMHVDCPAPGLLDELGVEMASFFQANYSRMEKIKYAAPVNPRCGLKMKALKAGGFTSEEAIQLALGEVSVADRDAMMLALR